MSVIDELIKSLTTGEVTCRYDLEGVDSGMLMSPTILPAGVVMVGDAFRDCLAVPVSTLVDTFAQAEIVLSNITEYDYTRPGSDDLCEYVAFGGEQEVKPGVNVAVTLMCHRSPELYTLSIHTASERAGIRGVHIVGKDVITQYIEALKRVLPVEDQWLEDTEVIHVDLEPGESLSEMYQRRLGEFGQQFLDRRAAIANAVGDEPPRENVELVDSRDGLTPQEKQDLWDKRGIVVGDNDGEIATELL